VTGIADGSAFLHRNAGSRAVSPLCRKPVSVSGTAARRSCVQVADASTKCSAADRSGDM